MSDVTVSIDHFTTEPITDQKWADIAIGLLHTDDYAIHTRTTDVASLLAENARLAKELDQAHADMTARWENSDHLAAKYHRQAQSALELRNITARELERTKADIDIQARTVAVWAIDNSRDAAEYAGWEVFSKQGTAVDIVRAALDAAKAAIAALDNTKEH